MTMGVTGKAMGFLATLWVARRFGASQGTDFVYYCITLFAVFPTFFSDINTNILLPRFVQMRETEGDEKGIEFLQGFLFLLLVPLLFLMVFLFAFKEPVLTHLSGFEPQVLDSYHLVFLYFIPTVFFVFLNDFAVNILQSYRNFLFSNLTAVIHGGMNLLCIWLFADTLGVASVALGYLTGAAIQCAISCGYLIREKKFPFPKMINPLKYKPILKLLPAALVFPLTGCIMMLLPDILSSMMEGGTLTAIGFARKIYLLVPTLLIYPLVLVLYPRLCSMVLTLKPGSMVQTILDFNRLLVVLVLPVILWMEIHGGFLVNLFFGGGQYSKEALDISEKSLLIFAPGLFALSIGSITGRTIMAMQKARVMYTNLMVSIGGALIFILLNWLLVEHLSYRGIALASTVYLLAFQLPVQYGLLYHYVSPFQRRWELVHGIKVLSLSMVSVFVAQGILDILLPRNLWNCVFSISGSLLFCALIHWFTNTREGQFVKEYLRRLKAGEASYAAHQET
jgi:putative peptidoglycan lipid II flippase